MSQCRACAMRVPAFQRTCNKTPYNYNLYFIFNRVKDVKQTLSITIHHKSVIIKIISDHIFCVITCIFPCSIMIILRIDPLLYYDVVFKWSYWRKFSLLVCVIYLPCTYILWRCFVWKYLRQVGFITVKKKKPNFPYISNRPDFALVKFTNRQN